ncbi:DNA transposition protein, AAA+ family ATPase [Elysia marginata]|uniref:DNA transposition protein, AAA+ family ATPase n=1 Tax=Elysia marginata TaxID=1093978 RepID=A0AAV4GIC2_9GAST|nr:DNA transposition protein, AAA+ family ATPase [Elysia marginata]
MSWNDLAKKSGINVSYLSAMRQGKNHVATGGKRVAIDDKWWTRLSDFMGESKEKVYWEFVKTKEAVRILSTLEDAKAYGYTNVIVGETGCGKTYVANMFRRKHQKHTYSITVSCLDNIADILDKIIEALKLKNGGKTKATKLKNIIKYLQKLHFNCEKPILIFDESEYLKQAAYNVVKELHEGVKGGICGIVLIGTSQILENIDRLRKSNKAGMPQLYRRVKFGIRQLPLMDVNYCNFLNGIGDKGLIRLLREHCDNYGELHDVLVPARREADRLGEALTERFVRMLFGFESYEARS